LGELNYWGDVATMVFFLVILFIVSLSLKIWVESHHLKVFHFEEKKGKGLL
jgi:hypothetical protein